MLELLRSHAEWLLQKSGLGVLAVGGSRADAKAAGLGMSGDGMRERSRAYAGLMTVALPFFPGDASVHLMLEGRTESALANVAWDEVFQTRDNKDRNSEPFRIFIGELHEDLKKSASRCQAFIATGSLVSKFDAGGRNHMAHFLSKQLGGTPFLKAHSTQAVKAINGIGDLAAALTPRPSGRGYRLMVPPGFSNNFWAGNYRELQHAFKF